MMNSFCTVQLRNLIVLKQCEGFPYNHFILLIYWLLIIMLFNTCITFNWYQFIAFRSTLQKTLRVARKEREKNSRQGSIIITEFNKSVFIFFLVNAFHFLFSPMYQYLIN